MHSTDGTDCCSTLTLSHCHLLDMQKQAKLTSLYKTATPTFSVSILEQSQRQRCTPPEIKPPMLRLALTTRYRSIMPLLNNNKAN